MSKRTRREFLEDSMFATAAAVAAGSSGQLFAQEEKQSSSPNERLNVCVVGVNGRGGSHIGAYAGRKDTRITQIDRPRSRSGESAASTGQQFPTVRNVAEAVGSLRSE